MKRVAFVGFGLVCVALGLYVAASRPWTTNAQFSGLVLLFLGTASLSCAWVGRETRLALMISAISVLVTLYGAEAYFSFAVPRAVEARVIEFSATHDRRTKRDVVLDLRGRGDVGAVPMIYPSFSFNFPEVFPDDLPTKIGRDILPLGAISNRTTVLCNESGQWSVYKADEHGFRNPQGAWTSHVEVAVVGDSFSHGNCVQDGEDWVGRLRARRSGVLNLGMGGNGPLSMLASIREYLVDRKPPIVVWQYLESHDTRIGPESTLPILKRYLAEPAYRQGLAQRQGDIDALLVRAVESALGEPELRARKPGVRPGDFARFSQLRARLFSAGPSSAPPATLDGLRPVLEEATRTVQGWGGRIYFLYLPTWYGVKGGDVPRHYATREQVLNAARAAGMTVIDAYPEFVAQRDPLSFFPYRTDYHYNAAGYALVADAVLKSIGAQPPRQDKDSR